MSNDSAGHPYRTVLFKLSGELLGGQKGIGFDVETVDRVASEIAEVANAGVRVGVVVGGGNFFRGGSSVGLPMSEVRSHQIGMLCTVANGMALEQVLISAGVGAVVQSSIAVPALVELFDGVSFANHMDSGRVVVFTGGTGNTHVSTDTGASLRAIGIGADILLKATRVNGIYSADPEIDPAAVRYEMLTYDEVLEKQFEVMDATSVALCRQYNMPIRVFDASQAGGISRVAMGSTEGTIVSQEKAR